VQSHFVALHNQHSQFSSIHLFLYSQKDWKKHNQYHVEVDPEQDDKAKEILLCSFERPHMRAFHCAWWSFFVAFFIWFAITPLLPEIRDDLNLTKQEVWNSSMVGIGGTIFVRFILGPLCDVYGARTLFAVILCVASIPTACTGFVQSANGLIIVRLFIGIAGGTFVMCQYWISRFFTKEIIGTANALAAGWGNLGAGITQLVMGSILFPIFKAIWGGDSEMAWRTVCIFPAVIAFATGVIVYRISDDAPKGNYNELKAHGTFSKVTTVSSFRQGASNRNTWLLSIQYACCFGVELTMNNAASLYFIDEFGQSTEAAAAIASIFGWLNLFARGLGGSASDFGFSKWGMRGRLWMQTIFLIAEGFLVLVFANTSSLGGSIATLVCFSLFVQAAEGTSYAIVPYVDPPNMGSVIGIVGAGGSVGALAFSVAFRELGYATAFTIMGACILGSSLLSVFIKIEGHNEIFAGEEDNIDKETGKIIVDREEEEENDEMLA
jgi:NNP family nitrate/nitrite transporter-like MFS transporter